VPDRLTAAGAANTPLASERAHRDALVARICHGMRVLDLAAEPPEDAVEMLDSQLAERFDAVVMTDGFERLPDPNAVADRLSRHAGAGMAVVLAVPNTKALGPEGGANVRFGHEEAMALIARLGQPTVLHQFLAEGSLIRASAGEGLEGEFVLPEHGEVEWAAFYIACVNLDARLAELGDGAYMQLAVAPQYNRRLAELERANRELWRENARLARDRLGTSSSTVVAADARARQLEERILELERVLASPRHKAVEQVRARLRRLPLVDRVIRRLGRTLS